jgi:ATP-dependent Lhr-like helicase
VRVASDHAAGKDALAVLPALTATEAEPLLALEAHGVVLRCRIAGTQAWCERRLLARIHRYTLERLRREIEPVTATDFWHYLSCWQHADPTFRLEGPRGAHEVVRKLAGFEAPAIEWESSILRVRLHDPRPEWLDQLTLTGEVTWGRLWGAGDSPIRSTPICLLPREDLGTWMRLAALRSGAWSRDLDGARGATPAEPLSTYARTVLNELEQRGACFAQELERATRLLPSHLEMGLTQLIGHGLVTCDSFGGIRRLITPPSKRKNGARRAPLMPAGRWSRFRTDGMPALAIDGAIDAELVEFVSRQLLLRYGVVFRRMLERERIPVPWRDLVRVYRHQELRGDVRGGRFVQGFSGEQYALPEAVDLMRRLRRLRGSPRVRALDRFALGEHGAVRGALEVAAADPLNLQGVLTPEARIPAQARRRVKVA